MLTKLQTFPTIPMKRFGANLYDEPIFRIVWSDSRTDIAGGKWPDGTCEYREVPRYPGIHAWILEQWKSPQDYAGTPQQYNAAQWDAESGLLTCGPYPNRGEYIMCYTFPFPPNTGMVEKIVTAIKLSRDLTPAEKQQGIMEPLEKQKTERENRFDSVFDNALGPWASADAVVGFGRAGSTFGQRQGYKRSGDMPHQRTDQQAPLPTAPNYFGTITKHDTIDKLTGDTNA